jgi:hypothetical protein
MSINFKQFFKPTKAFEEKNKARFLATFGVRYPATARSRWIFGVKTLAATLAVLALALGGISAYADTTNVPVESPLYPLKRVAESVQLAVTLPAAKPALEATFAARRATEITDLENNHPSSTLLPSLSADLGKDLDASVSAGLTSDRCNTLRGVFDASSSLVRNTLLSEHVGVLIRFRKQCAPNENSSTTSGTPFATSTLSSTFFRFPRGHERDSNGSSTSMFGRSTSTVVTSSSVTISASTSVASSSKVNASTSIDGHFHARIPTVTPPLISRTPPANILP